MHESGNTCAWLQVPLPTMAEDDPTRMNETILFEGATILGQTFDGGFWTGAKPLAFIENADTLTQVVVYWNTNTKEVRKKAERAC